MSGCGLIAADPGLSERELIRVGIIVAERAGALSLSREFCRQVDQLVEGGRLPGVDASALKARIRAFADAIATGLHMQDADPPGVLAAMREVARNV